jgi:beta-phosphoglucomutase-like phosphatase (HAD superfamily)
LDGGLLFYTGPANVEIESTLESEGLRRYFVVIAAAEDLIRRKPHPESFLLVLKQLTKLFGEPA